jgi:Zn-dependent membrane protease YugP
MMNFPLLLIFIVFALASWLVNSQLKSRFKRYSKSYLQSGLSGCQVAEKMLHDHGITDVRVLSVTGRLSDHYNPANKTVNLSAEVYNGRSVASAAVAAHECGHAVQHAQAYAPLKLRSALVPLQNVSARLLNIIFISMFVGAFLLPHLISFDLALLVIIACYGVFTLFAFVTLPVEINATQRALLWLNRAGITGGQQQAEAKDALKWAAYTYVVAALSALATLLYYVMLFLGRRD